jgi:hypothetical protein
VGGSHGDPNDSFFIREETKYTVYLLGTLVGALYSLYNKYGIQKIKPLLSVFSVPIIIVCYVQGYLQFGYSLYDSYAYALFYTQDSVLPGLPAVQPPPACRLPLPVSVPLLAGSLNLLHSVLPWPQRPNLECTQLETAVSRL